MKQFFLSIILATFALSPAFAEYFIIRNYTINVSFSEEGHADFEEIIEVEFTQPRHGIFRFIPLRSVVDGQKVDRIVKDVSVDGFKFSRSKENHNLVLKIGDKDVYVDGRQVYRISYRVMNPLNFFEEHAEFYWDLTGNQWPVIIESVAFQLQFPNNVRLTNEDVFYYTGPRESQEQDADVVVSSNSVVGNTTQSLMPEEGLTVAVRLPKDVFGQMSGWRYFLARHGLLLAPLPFLFTGLLGLFMARNRRLTIMTEYFPPENVSPAIAGGFVDHSVDNNDVLCLIPHLATKGFLRMEAEEGGFLKKDKITFFKLKDSDSTLMPFEREFHDALFSGGSRVELKSLKDSFYVHMNAVKASVKSWIKNQGWYEADQKTFGCLTAFGGLAALAWGAWSIFGRQNLDGIALIVTGLLLFYFTSRFNKRTPLGNEKYRKFEGFRQFIAKAERPVIERLFKEDPNYYDKTMAYALAFGYLKKWNAMFDGLLTQPPSWYTGPYIHGAHSMQSWNTFSESFPSEIDQVGSVFSSTPSSGGSGFGGGGGFSGGGSGGGGGGSW